MKEDWTAVAEAVNTRARELSLRQKEIADISGVSLAIVREIQQGRIQRRRNPRTLEALSLALDWHPQHLTAVLQGEEPPVSRVGTHQDEDPMIPLLNTIIREIRGLRAQVGTLTNRLNESEQSREERPSRRG